MAMKSGHMTLSMLVERLERFGLSHMKVYITHIKPIFLQEILSDLALLGRHNIEPLQQGITIEL